MEKCRFQVQGSTCGDQNKCADWLRPTSLVYKANSGCWHCSDLEDDSLSCLLTEVPHLPPHYPPSPQLVFKQRH
eukprot:m.484864 g.484864  ORF g.484864 m.484864 type:complete len:74 (+) comp70746_c0_seq1:34-255(+)